MKDCTWCHGKGVIIKPYSLKELNILEWSFVICLFVALMTLWRAYGNISLIHILDLVIIIVFTTQIGLWFIEALGLLTKKIPCPRCNNKNS